jgi:membrane-bound lytic murein transglycosylase MltF
VKSRKTLILYAFLLAAVIVAMRMLWTASHKEIPVRDYEAIRQESVLRILTEYSPQGYYIAGDTIKGFQYELSRAIAEVSGLDVQIRLEMSLPESFRALRNNTCDVIAQNIPITSELKEIYLFTTPIAMSKQVLVQRTAEANNGQEPLRNQLALARKTVYVPKDSPALLRLKHLEHEMADTIYIIEDAAYSSEQLAIRVAKGEIEYAVCDQQIARTLQNKLPEIDVDTDISFTQLQAWVVRKNSPTLLDSLNSWFSQIRESGRFNKIYRRYYAK